MIQDKTQGNYKNFRAALYVRALDLAPLKGDISPFKERFEGIYNDVKLDKVYLETHRDLVIPDEETMLAVKKYLNDKGIATAGGITVTDREWDNFKTYCYSNPESRKRLTEIVKYTARLFDEVLFDDFFFTNCKCPMCIEEKGDRSWTEFRLEQMTQASKELVLKPAKEEKAHVKVIIKYPNWYEHFQGLGFNLLDQPPLYDSIYTGNETRDAVMSAQHLQPYESYLVSRYYENIKPGKNLGGWVDPFGSNSLDRYAEQLWLTLFAKAPEIMLFDFFSIQIPIKENQRGAWQGQGTSFDFDRVTEPVRNERGQLKAGVGMSLAAGAALRQIDDVLGNLGNPLGVKSYKPHHSLGEDFLHNYIGMLGIPMDLAPEFPEDADTILLTEAAKHDSQIVEKIKKKLMDGKTVIITSGLLKVLQDKGLKDIVEMECTDKKLLTQDFQRGMKVHSADKPLLFPIIHYLTNDSWEDLSCMGGTSGTPLLHFASYGNSKLYVLNIPDNFDDLYHLPEGILNRIRDVAAGDMYVRLHGPSGISLFVYDNDTFIVESFLDETANVQLVLDGRFAKLENVLTSETLKGRELYSEPTWFGRPGTKTGEMGYDVTVKPHSYYVFKAY